MLVLKFGGTSVGSAKRFKNVANIVNDKKDKIIVLSAMSGTTNALENITKHLYKNENKKAVAKIDDLKNNYLKTVDELYKTNEFKEKGIELINSHFNLIASFTQDLFTIFEEKTILAQGELLSTALFHYYLDENKINSVLISALNFMRIDKDGEPDMFYIQENLKRELANHPNNTIFITQGYITRNVFGEIDNLQRGGSDYTASLIGAAINADEIQIWTDIDGMHNNDPRVVENTKPISKISFDEAAELAYFGAKILHPASIQPAKLKNIPVRIKNTLEPQAKGTLITSETTGDGIKAIAAKDNITAIKIKSGRMLLAYGFIRKVFEIFEIYKTPIDMVTTSEVAVSITIDDSKNLKPILEELKNQGTVDVESDHSIICIVGDFISESKGYAADIFNALENIPIRMISYGGSKHNVSLLVKTEYKKGALKALNKILS